MKRYKGLELDQHLKMAAELLVMRDKLQEMLLQVSGSYGTSSKSCKTAYKLLDILDKFRSDMDNAYFKDINPDSNISPYYSRKEK